MSERGKAGALRGAYFVTALRFFLAGGSLSAGLGGCSEPPVFPTQDRQQNQFTGRIEGDVVVTGAARGNAVLFLFEAERPPPPEGSGRPVSFTVVPREAIFGEAGTAAEGTGPFTAPFSFSLVHPGRYLIRGFLDQDGCTTVAGLCRPSDFIPWFGVTSEPNLGDVGGASIDLVTRAPRVIPVTEELAALERVQVTFADSATLPLDRPSFGVVAGDGVLGLTGAVVELAPEPLEGGVVHQGRPAFLVRTVDDDNDGVPDDKDGDGKDDLWPKILVRKLSDGDDLLADENDLDGDGVLDATGVEYPRADGAALDGVPDRVILSTFLEAPGVTATATPTPAAAPLRLTIRPLALDVANPAAPSRLASVPPGRYAITVLQFTGQSWKVPNELHPTLAPALGLPSVESQSFTVTVP